MEAGTPQQPQRPPLGSQGDSTDERPGVPWRILGVVLAITLGFAGAIMVALMIDIGGTPRCGDAEAIAEEREQTGELVVECFEGGQFQKTATLALGWPAGVIAGVGVLVALLFAGTGRQGQLMIWLTGAAIVLGGLSILVGSV